MKLYQFWNDDVRRTHEGMSGPGKIRKQKTIVNATSSKNGERTMKTWHCISISPWRRKRREENSKRESRCLSERSDG